MKFIDLFAGIGGFRLAFESVGGECVFTSEIEKNAIRVYKKNFGDHNIYGDITKIEAKDIPDFDVLCGGFPCQAFSMAGKRKGFDDPRGVLFLEICRILKEKQPKAFCLENVKNLLKINKGESFRIIKEALEDCGYHVTCTLINSKHWVPQSRERVVFIGHREKLVHIPLASFQTSEAVAGEPKLKNILEEYVENPRLAPPSTLERNERRKAENKNFLLRFKSENDVWGTVTKSNDIMFLTHQGLIRYPTIKEFARMFGFPESYDFDGLSMWQVKSLLGNSIVVPKFAYVAEIIRDSL
jgi:DNA (cytosine-5)-methyltransferase 1